MPLKLLYAWRKIFIGNYVSLLMNFINPDYKHEVYFLKDDHRFPNNERLPVLHYKKVLHVPPLIGGYMIRKLFRGNGYTNSWRNGIYDFHHYHSNTHELMAVCSGQTVVLLGGEDGVKAFIEKGDVLLLPAGVAHKNITPSAKVSIIGAYPEGKEFDMNYGNAGERPAADQNIKKVKIPSLDPVFGKHGILSVYWNK